MNQSTITISKQCELLNLARSTYYYHLRAGNVYSEYLMKLIDEEYTRHPFLGYRRITQWLKRQGEGVNKKRIARLMNEMGLQGIYPKRYLTSVNSDHRKYPYLLNNLVIIRPNHVWSADITYIRMTRGFMYLVAIMDWYSRYVLSWELSTSLEHGFCRDALQAALATNRADIFNTDQGCQFTCSEFRDCLIEAGIRISMDGRGRVFDNIFVERLWRSVKYEEVYLNEYSNPEQVRRRLENYFVYYNMERPHQSLGYRTPSEVYHVK